MRCWERLPPENLRILGLNLGVPPCAKCGEPLGARYRREGKQVCWSCTGIVTPPPPKWKDTPYALFHRRVCKNWHRLTKVWPSLTLDRTGRMAGPCPICHTAVLVVQVVDAKPKPTLDVDDCDNGCPHGAIGAVLVT